MRNALFFALPLTATVLFGGGYSQDDRDALLARLDETRRELVVNVEGVSHKQSMWTPDSRWTVLQVMEHLVLMEDYLFGLLQKSLEEVKPVAETVKLPDPTEADKQILRAMNDRSRKAKAPQDGVPQGKFSNRDEAMLAFTKSREKTANFVRTTKLDLRRYIIDTPMGKMDAHQWILMMCGHTQRHTQQISEVLRHPLYPRDLN